MFNFSRPVLTALAVVLGLGGIVLQHASAAPIDIATIPVAGTGLATPKPNVMLLMDTSKSMSFTHMPDELENTVLYTQAIGYRSAQCNSLYYDPNKTYTLPRDAAQLSFATPTFTGARYSYYSTTDFSTVDLSTSFRAYDTNTLAVAIAARADAAQPAYYYVYAGAGALNYATAPCTDQESVIFGTDDQTVPHNTTFTTSTGSVSGTWKRVIVGPSSGPGGVDERTNFAIWYTYYRTRMAMVKSSVSTAFSPLTDKFRIGFITVNPLVNPAVANSGVDASRYLAINDFAASQKAAWYTKLYSQEPSGSSPTREGLARVGRHYGGKIDGINQNMNTDPVQYSCQQNFTILTTDGYWNTAQESVDPSDSTKTLGPVMLDGLTKVGNQDNMLTPQTSLDRTDPGQYSHRPIWDGTTSGKRTDTNRVEQSRYAPCDSGEYYKTTSIIRRSTTQSQQRTQSLTKSTSQISMTTAQTSASTTQDKKTTASATRQTLQNLVSTQQTTKSTRQELQTTSSVAQGTSTTTATTTQILKTTSYMAKAQTKWQISTTQPIQTLSRWLQSTSQTTQKTITYSASTSQVVKTDTTYTKTTTQQLVSTSQTQQRTSRLYQSTSQLVRYDGATEQALPVASCTPSGTISCLTLTTGPTLVGSCTAGTTADFKVTTCSTTNTGPTPVQTCTAADTATSANGWTVTSCSPVNTGPTATSSCTHADASASNNWTTTNCTTSAPTVTQVPSCAPGVAAGVTTSCSAPTITTTPVQSCTPATTATTATTCPTVTTTPALTAACLSNTPASSGNQWTATTCTNSTASKFVQSCGSSGTSGNSYLAVSCTTATTTNVQVASCTTAAASSGNGWKKTDCVADATVASTGPVQSCATQSANSGNSFIATACTSNNTGPTDVASCTPVTATSGNNWTTTSCQSVVVSAATAVQPANCTAGVSGVVTTTCTPMLTTDVPSQTCVPNTTGPTYVSCRTVVNGPTAVASCTTAAASSGNSWTKTDCNTSTTPGVNVQTCVPVTAGAGNGNVATTCTPSVVTVGVSPGTCVAQTATATNNWVTITCPAAAVTGPTAVALNSCTPVTAIAGNSWTQTTCSTPAATTPTPVASCTAGTNPTTFVVTTCSTNNSAVVAVAPGSCTNVAASGTNQWTQTACTSSTNTVNVASGTCTPSAAGALPVVTCNTVSTGPTFVAAGSCTTGTDANFLNTTCSTVRTGPTFVGSCNAGTDANYKVTRCTTATTGPTQLALGSACTSEAASATNNWVATTCTSQDDTAGVAAGSCTPSAPGALPVISCSVATTGPTPVASCSEGIDGSFLQTSCPTTTSDPERTTSCVAVAPSAANGFQATNCDPIPGTKVQIETQTTSTTYTVSGNNPVAGTGAAGPVVQTPWTDVAGGICYPKGASLPSIDTSGTWKQSTSGMPSGCTAWPCTGALDPSSAVGGSANSLADVAQYYYITDLRPSVAGANPDPWKNDVPKLGSGIEDDRAPWQHMTTFVLGLGVSGTLNFQPDYKSALSGDFTKIRSYDNQPPLNWPVWPTSEPMPSSLAYNDARSIDDFWHTAVNGRGKFFSANDPDAVVTGLKEALAGIQAQAGAGAGAATSTLTPVQGDNTAYTGSYTSSEWTGDLKAEDIDLTTGNLSGTVKWSARTNLDLAVGPACDNRKIYVMDPSTSALVNFSWGSQGCNAAGGPNGNSTSDLPTALRSYFTDTTAIGGSATGLSQYPLMNAAQRSAALGQNLVNFIRGQKGFEGFVANDATKLYRTRTHALGDIVNSQPAFVKAPSLSYQDTGYAAFKTANASRTPMIYVGANDGMLHAFYAPSLASDPNYANAGQEAWAYIPNSVVPSLYKLADANYSEKHVFFVDGSVTSGDVYDATATKWRSIIVGGLNAGGQGYYALDVTNGAAPKALWEFNFGAGCASNPVGASTDCNIGLTFGRPVITKLKNGKWVVMVTSGYNNIQGGGADGKGYLYVLDAITGQIISRIGTGAGSLTTPSGLKDLNFYVSNIAYDNTALQAYGADILGNVWRFDINDSIPPAGMEATLIGTAKDPSGNPQPITTRPELAEVSGNTMIFVATGKLLATSDLGDTSVQTVYGIKDPMTAASPSYPNADLRAALAQMVLTQTGTGSTATRAIACAGQNVGDCSNSNGWYVDLPDGGERVNVDMQTVLGTLVFASNVPSDTMCLAGGYSWLNYVNLINGQAVATSDFSVASVPFFSNSLVVGMGLVGLGDGTIKALGRSREDETVVQKVPVGSPPPLGKRISWREITQ